MRPDSGAESGRNDLRDARTELRRPWVVGVSGASGTPYARAVLNGLLDAGCNVDLVVSRAARLTILDETGLSFRDSHWHDDLATWLGRDLHDSRYWTAGDLAAGPASGSYPTRGMVVVPVGRDARRSARLTSPWWIPSTASCSTPCARAPGLPTPNSVGPSG